MLDDRYKDAFKEVYEILRNTDDELVQKVPQKFIKFLQNNMNVNYQVNIDNNIEIDKQILLPETEDILSIIYRNYWATNEEKQEFLNKDKQELKKIEKYKQNQYKNITEIFEKKKKSKQSGLNNSLMVIQEENFIKRLLKKIVHIFKR